MKLEENVPVKETLRDITSSGYLIAVLLDSDRVLRHECFGGEMVSDCNSHVCNRIHEYVRVTHCYYPSQAKSSERDNASNANLQPPVGTLMQLNPSMLVVQLKWTQNYTPYHSHHLIYSA